MEKRLIPEGSENILVVFRGTGQARINIPLYRGYSFEECVRMKSDQIEGYARDGETHYFYREEE